MRLLVKLSPLAALLVLAYCLYQRPEIRVLFTSETAQEDPLAFLNDLPEVKPNPRPEQHKTRYKPRNLEPIPEPAPPLELQESDAVEEAFTNQVPNDQLQRVFLQILAAKKLADGVSLSVTDDKIELLGLVDTVDKRRQILDVIERGREARRIDAHQLKVKN